MDAPMSEAGLTVAADTSAVDAVHALVDRIWTADSTLDELLRLRFESALIEVVGNVVAHATNSPGKPVVTLQLTITADDAQVQARMEDDGGRADVDLSTPAAMPDWMAERGRGLALAQAMCDELTYLRRDGHNMWVVGCQREF